MMAMDNNCSLSELAGVAMANFQKRFGRPAQWLVAAPGRVNLIGEHTDYNDGFVLPMAIDRYVVIAADMSTDPTTDRAAEGMATVFSGLVDEQQAIPLDGRLDATLPNWAKYVQGTLVSMGREGVPSVGFDAVIESNVPLGGGLSSSAALEVATATLLEEMAGKRIDPMAKALACQQAEHEAVGVPCGIMDQFSSTLCQADHLMLLDCRNQQTEMIPLTDPDVTVLVINSNVKHELTGGEYAERRQQCEAAAKVLGVESLRDLTTQQLEQAKPQLEELLYRRARHVVGEIDRTTRAADAIRGSDWGQVGRLMYASHDSLRDDYEVSCQELDLLVDLARELGANRGVIGSRMTGGGFGGCTVTLVQTQAVDDVIQAITTQYQQATGIAASPFTTRPARGAHVLTTC